MENIPREEDIKEYYKENLDIEQIVEDDDNDIDNLSDNTNSELTDVENENYLNL